MVTMISKVTMVTMVGEVAMVTMVGEVARLRLLVRLQFYHPSVEWNVNVAPHLTLIPGITPPSPNNEHAPVEGNRSRYRRPVAAAGEGHHLRGAGQGRTTEISADGRAPQGRAGREFGKGSGVQHARAGVCVCMYV